MRNADSTVNRADPNTKPDGDTHTCAHPNPDAEPDPVRSRSDADALHLLTLVPDDLVREQPEEPLRGGAGLFVIEANGSM